MSKQIYRSQNKLALAILISLFCCFLSFANQATARTEVQIKRVGDFALFGNYQYVTVNLANNTNTNGYSKLALLITYDTTYFSYLSVQTDSLFNASGWERLTTTLEQPGLIRIIAQADTDGAAPFPSSHFENQNGSLFQITFKVTSNTHYSFVNSLIQFYWQACDDNCLFSRNEDSLLVADSVYLYTSQPAEPTPDTLPTNQGLPDSCLSITYPGRQVVRDVIYQSQSIDLQSDWNLPLGDVNLNHIINEPADRDIFCSYFKMGIAVFDGSDNIAQIAQTDINGNGIALEVRDLVFMQRIINGDTVPYNRELGPSVVPTTVAPDTAFFYQDTLHKLISVYYPDRLATLFVNIPGVTFPITLLFSDSADNCFMPENPNIMTIFPDKPTDIASGPLLQYQGGSGKAGISAVDYHQRPVPVRVILTSNLLCDDLNASGTVNIQDIIYLVAYMFASGPAPLGTRNGDVSCDNMLNILDLISMVNYFFNDSSTPCCLGQ